MSSSSSTPTPKDVRIVMNQTNYTEQESIELLCQYGTPTAVVRRYLGLGTEPPSPQMTEPIPKSQLNQAMFAQFRRQLDMSKYRESHPMDEDEIAQAMYAEHMKKNKSTASDAP